MSKTPVKIAALAGDGIGPETMREALKVLRAIEQKHRLTFDIQEGSVGWAAIDQAGKALPDATLALCKHSGAILFGAVGLHYRDPEIAKEKRPERAALLRLRNHFHLFCNLRPVKLLPPLAHACPLRPERQGAGIDLLVVRESTAGLYHAYPKKTEEVLDLKDTGIAPRRVLRAVDTMAVSSSEVERVAHVAFRAAWLRRRKLTSIDKANVLETSILWREVVTRVSRQYPDVTLEHLLVDTAAMQLILRPGDFDVMLCENTFGEILGDEAAALAGSVGLLPTATLAQPRQGRTFGLYSPAGGSAPDIAGKGIANPIAQILSAALMLRYSFGLDGPARTIEQAVDAVIAAGLRTPDLWSADVPGLRRVGTSEMGDAITAAL